MSWLAGWCSCCVCRQSDESCNEAYWNYCKSSWKRFVSVPIHRSYHDSLNCKFLTLHFKKWQIFYYFLSYVFHSFCHSFISFYAFVSHLTPNTAAAAACCKTNFLKINENIEMVKVSRPKTRTRTGPHATTYTTGDMSYVVC